MNPLKITQAEWDALDANVQTAYAAYLDALTSGDANDIAKAKAALDAAYAKRDGKAVAR